MIGMIACAVAIIVSQVSVLPDMHLQKPGRVLSQRLLPAASIVAVQWDCTRSLYATSLCNARWVLQG